MIKRPNVQVTESGTGPRDHSTARPLAVIALRPVRFSDALFLYDLRNESAVRRSALSTQAFSLREHRAWLKDKMASNDCRIYIAIKGRRRIGQIRFDIDSAGMAETDVALAVETRGRGCGTDLIREGCRILFAEPQVRACVAHVKIKNEASRRAFQRAGFHEVGVKRLKGQTVRELMLRRSRKREVGQANPGVL